MTKIIDAKAVISAADNTGNVFDKIAAKFKGLEKNAKALEGIKPPKFTGDMFKELERLKLSEKELQGVRKSYAAFNDQLKAGPVRAAHYFRALDDWKDNEVHRWREMKSAVDETGKAHDKFFAKAGKHVGKFTRHAAMHAVGIGSAVYAAGHAIRSTAEGVAERGRATTRYEQMGLSQSELEEGQGIASQISSKFPSISRTEVLDYLRSNASRLGSWERSKEVAEPYARALIANKLSGGSEHEMDQTVRALEGMGKANTSEQLTSGLNAFARAKAANPDYTGEQFRSDMAAASSAKYALSKDYMENVFPILASHTSGFGNKLSTGLSAMVGQRMTKPAKAALAADGLTKDGELVDKKGWIENNFEWTQKHIRPLLEKEGVKFGEDMSNDDKAKVVSWLAKRFSARNAADLVATNLLDEPLVEKGRHRNTAKLEDMDRLQKKDPGLVWEGMKNQLEDTAIAASKTSAIIGLMDAVTNSLSNMAKTLETGQVPKNTNLGRYLDYLHNQPSDDDRQWGESLNRRLNEADSKLQPAYGLNDADTRAWRLKKFDLEQGKNALANMSTMPPIFTDEEIERLKAQDVQGRVRSGDIPLPRPRPAEANNPTAMPPVQSLEGATPIAQLTGSAEVKGEAELKVTVEATPYFTALVSRAENAIKLVGTLLPNGAGSSGKSSPDAAAPAVGFTGAP